ncbi:MAG: GntR family transcriptional regulator [Proteobacteria bacterium]|jgi:GntR family transcriptional regulator|nr:GntR family transcriptional regulator [Pseudomonadota bacterium]MDA1301903.1 GntR family transcriptional regulator [Pseudomonadota bacterium]
MFVTIDIANPKPAYLQITEAVCNAIALGALKPGDRLPAIREAATQARVNRNTVSRAYLELEHQGLVHARQGSGYFVSELGSEKERSRRVDQLRTAARSMVVEAQVAGLELETLLEIVRQEHANHKGAES